MPSMFFGQYLLAKGLVNREALLDAIRRGREANKTIPELAVREDLLTRGAADSVMTLFRMSERSMEELCIDNGLTAEQYAHLLALQGREHRRVGDCLVDGGYLSRQDADRHAAEFQAEERLEQEQLEANLEGFAEKRTISCTLDLLVFHFRRMVGRSVKLKSVESAVGGLRSGHRRYAQRIVGGQSFTIAIDMPNDLAQLLAEGFLGITVDLGSAVADDAVTEFVNVAGGNVCTHLESPGDSYRPEPPFVSGGDIPPRPEGPSVLAELVSEDAPFAIHLFFE